MARRSSVTSRTTATTSSGPAGATRTSNSRSSPRWVRSCTRRSPSLPWSSEAGRTASAARRRPPAAARCTVEPTTRSGGFASLRCHRRPRGTCRPPAAAEQVGQCVEQRPVARLDRCGRPFHAAIVDGCVAGASLARVPEWSPEIVVDEPLARRLLRTQFPELELASLRLAGEGWDNTAWLVDERWLFRFPRRRSRWTALAASCACYRCSPRCWRCRSRSRSSSAGRRRSSRGRSSAVRRSRPRAAPRPSSTTTPAPRWHGRLAGSCARCTRPSSPSSSRSTRSRVRTCASACPWPRAAGGARRRRSTGRGDSRGGSRAAAVAAGRARARRPAPSPCPRRGRTTVGRDRLGRRLPGPTRPSTSSWSGVRCRRLPAPCSSTSTGRWARTACCAPASSPCFSALCWRCTPAPRGSSTSSGGRSTASSGRWPGRSRSRRVSSRPARAEPRRSRAALVRGRPGRAAC